MAGGVGGSPHKNKRGNELPTLATPPRVGPKTLANPQSTGVGKGVEGAQPPPRGRGGCAPKIFKEGGEQPTPANLPRVGLKTLQALSPRGWENGGPGGASPWQYAQLNHYEQKRLR